jgi:hypothetical protein
MKKLIIMAVSLLTLNAASFASTIKENNPVFTKKVEKKAAFQHIVINGDVDVVLVENDYVQVDICSEQNNNTSVSHYVNKGILYINRVDVSLGRKPIVIVAVNDLQSLEVNGDGDVTSKGSLRSSKLKLMINGESKLNVRNRGELMIESNSNIKLDIQKTITGTTQK